MGAKNKKVTPKVRKLNAPISRRPANTLPLKSACRAAAPIKCKIRPGKKTMMPPIRPDFFPYRFNLALVCIFAIFRISYTFYRCKITFHRLHNIEHFDLSRFLSQTIPSVLPDHTYYQPGIF